MGLSMMRDTSIVEFLVVLDSEGNEIQALFGLRRAAGSGDHGGSTAGSEYGAVSLLGHAPRLENELFAPDHAR
jgi:hypothetical protein